MSMIPPLRDLPLSMSSFQDELNRLFDRFYHAGVTTGPLDGQEWAPRLDIYEAGDHLSVVVEVPGLNPEAIDINLTGLELHIKGVKEPAPSTGGDYQAVRVERQFGTFRRTITLPVEVEEHNISAKYKQGILTITLPKSQSCVARSIHIDVAEE
jgi:HSP20 family protein